MPRRRLSRGGTRSFVQRWFRCPECGQVVTASKHCETAAAHLKDMYCPGCRCERKFEQFDSERVAIM